MATVLAPESDPPVDTTRARQPDATGFIEAEANGLLADGLAARLPGLGRIEVRDAGAVIGTHVGPGMVAVVVVPGP